MDAPGHAAENSLLSKYLARRLLIPFLYTRIIMVADFQKKAKTLVEVGMYFTVNLGLCRLIVSSHYFVQIWHYVAKIS